MSLSLRQIRYISEVAREGSIQAASHSLRISQSSIMAAIDNAEEVVGARLFERRPARGIQVTPAGRTFLATARTMLAAESEFIRSIDQIARAAPRTIRIGCFEPFGPLFMPEILRRVVADNDETSVSLVEGDQPQLRSWLNEGSVDAIVTYDIGYGFGDSVTPICKAPPHVLLHASDSLATQDRVSIVEIAERPLVLLDLPETATYLLALFDIFAARPRISFHTRSYESVRAAVSVGFGAAILNLRPLMRSMQDSEMLIRRPIVEQLPAPTLVVADIYGTSKPWIVRRLIDVMRVFFDEAGYPALE